MSILIITQNCIYVRTERPAYVGGDIVNGTVYLNLVRPTDSKGIFLKVKGYEKVFWEERKTRQVQGGGVEHYTETHRDENSFFKVKLPLHTVRGQFMPGQYCFPFSFPLPRDLPGVFHEAGNRWGTAYDARTRYKIKAECDVAGFLKSDIKHSQDLTVHEGLQTAVLAAKGEMTSNVMVCCCINKGSATMRTHFDKNVYVPGETCNILCEVDNRSTVAFTHIKTKLMRNLRLHAHGHVFDRTETLIEERFPGVSPGEKLLGTDARSVPILLSHSEHGAIQPQTKGRLVNCRYWIDVECDIPMAPDIEIHMPISIFAPVPPDARWMQFQLPQGWAPQEFSPARLDFGAAVQY